MESDEELTEQVARFEEENEKIFQAANEETLRAMESLAQMAPPTAVEENPVFDFKAKEGCG